MEKLIKSFVSYKEPNQTNFITLTSLSEPLIHGKIDFLDQNRFYFSSFDNKVIGSLQPDNKIENKLLSIPLLFNKAPTESKRYAFIKQVQLAKKKIKSGDFSKVVLSKTKHILRKEGFNWQTLFKKMCNMYPNQFVYTLYTPLTGLWMGASPELFLKKDNEGYHTIALAGTKKIDEKWTQKEKEEQLFVTEFITSNISHNSKKMIVSRVHDHKIGSIKHLETNIDFQLYFDEEINTIIQKMNPTPAVCGVPKENAFSFIKHIEEHDRSFYTGLIGPVGINQKTNLFVNLRCLQVCQNQLVLYTGCGITKDSDPVAEWNETEEKCKILSNLLDY